MVRLSSELSISPEKVGLIGSRFAFLGAANLAAAGMNFLIILLIAQALGTHGLGEVSLGLNVLTYGMIAMNFGTDVYAVRAVAADPTKARPLLSLIARLRLILCVPVILTAIILCFVVPTYREASGPVLIFVAAVIPNSLSPIWLAQAKERTGVIAGALFVTAFLNLIFAGAFLLVGARPWAYALAKLLADAIVVIALLAWVKDATRQETGIIGDDASLALLLRKCAPIAGSKLVRGLGFTSDLFVLGLLTTTTTVGLYTAPFRLFSFLVGLNLTYGLITLPLFSRAASSGLRALRRELAHSLRFALPAWIAFAIAGALSGPVVLPTLFGEGFEAAAGALGLLLFAGAVQMANRSFSQALIAWGRTVTEMRLTTLAIGASLPLKVLLTWQFGILGTAGATLIGELSLLTLQALSFRRTFR